MQQPLPLGLSLAVATCELIVTLQVHFRVEHSRTKARRAICLLLWMETGEESANSKNIGTAAWRGREQALLRTEEHLQSDFSQEP